MIVWGRYASYFDSGKLGDGARYDPATDTWTSLNATGAPAPRYSHGAAWRRRQQSGGLAARARGGYWP
jgi:hypothetical protein